VRILLASTSGAGHFGPLVAFGAACRRAGHDVQVAAPRSFEPAVRRTGYRYWPCADVADDALAAIHAEIAAARPDEQNRLTGRIVADLAPRAILPGMLAAIDEWQPDLILRDVAEFGSYVAAELRCIPQFQVLIGLDKFNELMITMAAPLLAPLRESVGLSPDPGGDRLRAIPALSMVPEIFEEPGIPRPAGIHRYRETIDIVVPDDDQLIYVTFGTVSSAIPSAAVAFRTVVEALADVPARLLVTTGDNGDLVDGPSFPPNVRIEKWVPQATALHGAAAMVCHGGMGTVLGALAAGVPLVVVPQFADHPDNAARVAALGAGIRVGTDGMSGPVDASAVRAATERVLSEPAFRTAAHKVAAEIVAMPPTDAVVELFDNR